MTGDGFGQEMQFREVLKACDDPDRRPVLIHCARGTCRTGRLGGPLPLRARRLDHRRRLGRDEAAVVQGRLAARATSSRWSRTARAIPLPDPPVTLDRNGPVGQDRRPMTR